MDKRLKAVLDRGAKLREKMSKTEGGFLPSYEFAKLCKPQSTHRGVINRYRSGRLLAYKGDEGSQDYRFPVWQLVPGAEQVLRELPGIGLDDWGRIAFFLTTSSTTPVRPLDLLRAGKINEAVRAAKLYAAELEEVRLGELASETRDDILERVCQLQKVIGPARFAKWLRAPNDQLDGSTPLQILSTKQRGVVADLADDILSGAPS